MAEPIDDGQLKAIVESEIRSAMGELTGDLANERSEAMDYYYGEPTGKLYQPNVDRSKVVITTLRDTVEWMMPQLMRMFAQADKVVEFDAVGSEDEEAAEQETQAINHIFWRENEGFLILYTWFKDALLQKNGTVKYWIEESEDRDREEYDGLTDIALTELLSNDEYEVLEHEASEIQSMDGMPLHHVVVERTSKNKTIHVDNVPPEEFLISDDARSLDVQTQRPRMTGHHSEKRADELREMGFDEDAIVEMMKSGDDSDRYDEEHIARYNLSDEQQILSGGTDYAHESQRTTRLYELYMDLDRNGDGYAELLKIYYAGDYIEVEEADHVPFACLTPYINPHKHHGLSEYDMVHDLQEIASQIFRNLLDNMYQTNNMRPIVNENVDLDSLLVSRAGAPIYTEGMGPVGNDVGSFAPPPMWEHGLTLLEYLDQIRKDRTGIGDETMGLDPHTLANANTGVMIEAIEAARGKIELVARIFAETGIKWLFRGIHELARKSYDQELRYELSGEYVSVKPQEWRKRTNLTINVGTASGSQQRELAALMQIGDVQSRMVEAGGLGVTILPSHIYRTAKELAENLGRKDGDKYFLDPALLGTPEIQQLIATQLPQQSNPQADLLAATAKIEGAKVESQKEKNKMDFAIRQAELTLKGDEMNLKRQIDEKTAQMNAIQEAAKHQTEVEKARAEVALKATQNDIDLLKVQLEAAKAEREEEGRQYQAELKAVTELQKQLMSMAQAGQEAAQRAEERAAESRAEAQRVQGGLAQTLGRLDNLAKDLQALDEDRKQPRRIKRDASGRPVAIGEKSISYNDDGTIKQIG